MQGGSSGPIEFSHLLLGALWGIIYKQRNKSISWVALLVGVVLLFGIFQSFSRAAILGSIILMGGVFLKNRQLYITIFISLIVAGMFTLLNQTLYNNIVQRAGTSDHITRPIEAIKKGIENPIFGELGAIGPVARLKNLKENNDDKALIAENVFVDIFAQTGGAGVLLFCLLITTIIRSLNKFFILVSVVFVGLMNFATIFDMIPISILFFTLWGFGSNKES